MDEEARVGTFANCESFLKMGKLLASDPAQGLEIREGQIFEGKTVKGGKNLIIAMRCTMDGWMIFIQGDKAKKVRVETFINAVLHGDLEPKMPHQCDVGRLSMATIAIDAIANRRTAEEHIDIMGEDAEHRYMKERSAT